MCYNCGCGDPNDDMGKKENITEQKIQDATHAMGMKIKDSKKNMIELLQKTLEQDEAK